MLKCLDGSLAKARLMEKMLEARRGKNRRDCQRSGKCSGTYPSTLMSAADARSRMQNGGFQTKPPIPVLHRNGVSWVGYRHPAMQPYQQRGRSIENSGQGFVHAGASCGL